MSNHLFFLPLFVSFPEKPWSKFITSKNQDVATEDGIDLLSRLLVYDHQHRATVSFVFCLFKSILLNLQSFLRRVLAVRIGCGLNILGRRGHEPPLFRPCSAGGGQTERARGEQDLHSFLIYFVARNS